MDEKTISQKFNEDLEKLMAGKTPTGEDMSEEYLQTLAAAHRLMNTNFSAGFERNETARGKIHTMAQKELPRQRERKAAFNRVLKIAKLAADGALIVSLGLGLIFLFRNFLPNPAGPAIAEPSQTSKALFTNDDPTASPSAAVRPTDLTTATEPATSLPAEMPVPPSAPDLALTAGDLGEGWALDAEVTEMDARYYLERGEGGKAVIGKGKQGYPVWFEPELVESISLRGFSHPEQKLVLFQVVAVFKETAQAREETQWYLQAGCDLPCEDLNVYEDGSGDISTRRDAQVGDESILLSVRDINDEQVLFFTALNFRKGRVFVSLFSVAQWDDPSNAPPLSEAQLEELARIVEARIP
jgi:hypothetical protein